MGCQQGRTHRKKSGQLCTHTLSAPTPTLLPWSQKKPFGSSWQDTAQGKPQASGPAGHHGKPLLYYMQIQHVTRHCKNFFTAILVLHLPRKCSGRVCPDKEPSLTELENLHLLQRNVAYIAPL